MKTITRLFPFISLVLVFLLSGCLSNQPANPTAFQPANTEPAAQLVHGDFLTSSPEAQGMDSARLNQMLTEIDQRSLDIDSVLVVRHGSIVLEQYYHGNIPSSTHGLYSVTKSFVSALVGMAINQGAIQGVEQKVLDFFPGRTFANPDPRKTAMTVENVLTMSTGLQWNEGDPEYQALYVSGDWVANMLDRPIVEDPGSRFNYCSGCTHLLAAIVGKATGMGVQEFAVKYLFKPLGISQFTWDTNPQGEAIGGWGLKLASRDLARLGYLYLHQGNWNGQQVLPASWVEASTRSHISTGDGAYGYQWWIYPDLNAYAAQGRYGQMIFVRPESDLVVVFTATIDGDNPEIDLIRRHVLTAIK